PPGMLGPALGSGALDACEAMAKGRWLRRRRWLAAGSAGLAAAAAVIAISHLSAPSHPSPVLARPRAASTGSPGQAASPVPTVPGPSPREGRVIPAGAKDAAGELVFYGVRIHLRQLPGTTFGIMAGLRNASGGLTPEVEANETTGPDTAPGFHAVQSPSSTGSPAVAIPEFGYYSGPAATITARQGGRLVHADLARWSVNRGIVIFWFSRQSATAGTAGTALTGLAAYDAAGHQLPAGHPAPGQG
ncbi:MAG: hypothetical protein ACR2MP_04070, partial [Streptosporangiaceae bacterium]